MPHDSASLLIAAENLPLVRKVYPGKKIRPELTLPERLSRELPPEKDPLTEIIRGRLEITGPATAESLSDRMRLPTEEINQALYRLENEGFVLRGSFSGKEKTEWCERRLLARIHRYTIRKLRSEIQPVSSSNYMRFLFSWHQVMPGTRAQGPTALEHVLQKLEGFEAPAAAWEGDILPARVANYDYQWLDMLCVAGKISWGRFIEGVWGEQFALPEAITELRRIVKTEKSGMLVSISAADPLNLTGILTPGKRVPGYFGNRILYRDGVPVAIKEAKEIQFLIEPEQQERWDLQTKLVKRTISPLLRKYLGKGVY